MEKLVKYYHYIGEKKGFVGKIELAKLTLVPSIKAAIEPDSTENILMFKAAIEKITGEPAPDF